MNIAIQEHSQPLIIDGKATAQTVLDEIKSEVQQMKAQGIEPCLAVVLVGDDPASHVYVRNKVEKALYVGISSYSPERTQKMAELMREWKIPLLIHQPSYNLLNRWVDSSGLLDTLESNGMGCIAFTPLAQGLLTGKYLNGIPEGSRMQREGKKVRGLTENMLTEENLNSLRLLNEMAQQRGQSMAQMALSWLLKDRRVTSVLIGASRPQQLEENVQALKNLTFSAEELAQIDQHVADGQLNLWQTSSDK